MKEQLIRAAYHLSVYHSQFALRLRWLNVWKALSNGHGDQFDIPALLKEAQSAIDDGLVDA